MRRAWIKLSIVAACVASGLLFYGGVHAQQSARQERALPRHLPAPGGGKNLVVQLCDGETNLEVAGVKPGERLTPEQAQSASNELMRMWMAKQSPEVAAAWARETASAQQAAKPQPAAPAKARLQKKAARVETNRGLATATNEQPNDFTPRDQLVWKRELEREISYGNQIFHDDKLLGSTNGVSCAMCHPNGANTHPETYPKFQVQLKRVALLRDMINWCIENPSRGTRLSADDPKMRALEAYILSQRKGVPMEFGKH